MSRTRRGGSGPELTVALLVAESRSIPKAVVEAARSVSEDVLLVGGQAAPADDAAVRVVPTLAPGLAPRMAAALGSARGRWTLFVRADESVHTPHARTLFRYLHHETATGFFVPLNDRLPLLRLVPTAAGRAWGDDPLPSQAWLEAEPTGRLLISEGLDLGHRAPWPTRPTRPQGPWLRSRHCLALGRVEAAARAARSLPEAVAESPAGLALRGEIAFWREGWPEAMRLFERARTEAVQPFDPAAQAAAVGIGRVHEALGDLLGAEAAYRAALATMPLDRAAMARLISVEWRLGASWPESVGRLVRAEPWAWRGVGRSLDRVARPEAQLRALRTMPMSYGRDLFLSRAALATGDVAAARRSLARAQSESETTALGYQVWLTELAGGSAAESRAAAARAGDLTASARLALLLAATSVLGENAELPLLRPEEALEVSQWLLVVLADLALLGLKAQAQRVARLIGRVLGRAGAAQAAAVLWRVGRGEGEREPSTWRRPALRRPLILPRPQVVWTDAVAGSADAKEVR